LALGRFAASSANLKSPFGNELRAGQGAARRGQAGPGEAGQGTARQGRARHGRAGRGVAGLGWAGQGKARLGLAGPGVARHGEVYKMIAMRPSELAQRWQCTKAHVRALIKRGNLPHFRVGGRLIRIPLAARLRK